MKNNIIYTIMNKDKKQSIFNKKNRINLILKLTLLGLIILINSEITYAEQCNETWRPCVYNEELELVECTATSLSGMFVHVTDFNNTIGDITGWDTSCITDMSGMFAYSDFNQDISGWDTSNVQDMNSMFDHDYYFNQPIGTWDVINAERMSFMFNSASSFNQPLNPWDTHNVQYMDYMFDDTSVFNQDISEWNTSNVITMESMFESASAFNQDISRWDVSHVVYTDYMFRDANQFNLGLNLHRLAMQQRGLISPL